MAREPKKIDRLLVDLVVAHPEHVGAAVQKMADEREVAIDLLIDMLPAFDTWNDEFGRRLKRDVLKLLHGAGVKKEQEQRIKDLSR